MKHILIPIAILSAFTSVAQPAWQQRVDSKIEVQLDDNNHMLYASEELTYTNNSPDTLTYIYIHLWPNAYKNDHTPFARQADLNGNTTFYYSKTEDRGYIDSIQFNVDGQAADHYSTDNTPDITRLDLPKPLLPGKTIRITTPFKVKIPKVFSRMGHTGQAYYISQWFPKPAVYDQKGWHPISYLDQGEFYSEYGSYDVTITLPSNYVVMATGNCMDATENAWMDKQAALEHHMGADKKGSDDFPPSAGEMKTIRFHEDNVHDFAWFADKRWWVKKDTVYSPGSNQLVTTWAAYMPGYQFSWEKANDYLKETVRHYGKWVGPYQYKTIKAVLGDLRAGGGMEYPTVTVVDKKSSSALKTVIIHEAGHNWFYGMLGSNERDHAWMDEGINTFYEQKTSSDVQTGYRHRSKRRKVDESLLYFERAAVHTDQRIDQTSPNFEKTNYGLDVYYKTAKSLQWLEEYMGKENFEAGMHEYFEKWHFHHPYPEDFRTCMQHHEALPLDWFFDDILKTDKRIDYKIVRAYGVDSGNTDVVVHSNSRVIAPLLIDAWKGDSIVARGWSVPFNHSTTIRLGTADWDKLKINDVIPDSKSANDVYRRRALFHHFGLRIKPVMGLNLSDYDKVFISPALGYNQYDGTMAGLLIHNLTIPENRFRFAVAPLFSFETSALVGAGSVGYLWYPRGVIKEVMLQADGKMFHYNEYDQPGFSPSHLSAGYTKVAPSISFTFNEHNALSPVTRVLTLKPYSITEDYFYPGLIASAPGVVPPVPVASVVRSKTNTYETLTYRHKNDRTYNPFSYTLEGQMGADFAKISAEGNLRIDYNTRKKSLYVRAFLGKFFATTNTTDVISRYELNATYSGMDDYLYDGTYIARSAQNKIASQQISVQEGGFKVPTLSSVARSDNWMATLNLKTDLPFWKLPIRLFLDAGLIPNATPTFTRSGSTTMLYDGGVEVYIGSIASLYVPVIMSNDFQNRLTDTYGKKNVFGRSISFTLAFRNLNWLKAPAQALKLIGN